MTPISNQEIYKLFDFHLTKGKRGQFFNGEHCELILSILAEQRKEIEATRERNNRLAHTMSEMVDAIDQKDKEIEELREQKENLTVYCHTLLPMAKGWAYSNPVGRNQEIVQEAEEFLQPPKQ